MSLSLLGLGALVATSALLFTALKWMPVADAISVFFLEPMILTVLSAIFLGEKVGWRRMLSVLAGIGQSAAKFGLPSRLKPSLSRGPQFLLA